MKILVIANASRRQAMRKAEELKSILKREHQVVLELTKHKGHASQLVTANVQLIIAIGGDGTMNECVNGLMNWKDENPETQLPVLALLPSGSGNDFARNFGWKGDVVELVKRIEQFSTRKVDVGKISSHNTKRYFINVAGAGFDAEVVKHVDRCPARLNGNLKFGWSILKTFFTYSKRSIIFRSEEFSESKKMFMLAVANGKFFGSGICISPDAELVDGMLNVMAVGNVSLFQYLWHLPKLRRGEKIIHPEVRYWKTSRIEISGDAELEMDGERGSTLPVTIELIPQAIELLV